jgi:hypothetical protein
MPAGPLRLQHNNRQGRGAANHHSGVPGQPHTHSSRIRHNLSSPDTASWHKPKQEQQQHFTASCKQFIHYH